MRKHTEHNGSVSFLARLLCTPSNDRLNSLDLKTGLTKRHKGKRRKNAERISRDDRGGGGIAFRVSFFFSVSFCNSTTLVGEKELECKFGYTSRMAIYRCSCHSFIVFFLSCSTDTSWTSEQASIKHDSKICILFTLALLEKPAGALVLGALEALNGRVGSRSVTTTTAEGLGDPATGAGEAKASHTARGRVQAARAACLCGFQALLDSSKLHFESNGKVSKAIQILRVAPGTYLWLA